MSMRGYRQSYHRSRGNDQFWVHADPSCFADSVSTGRRSNNGFVPAAVASENVRMERRQSSKTRHAEVYAYHRRLDNCLMASVTILSLLATFTVIGLVVWAVISCRQSEASSSAVYRPLEEALSNQSLTNSARSFHSLLPPVLLSPTSPSAEELSRIMQELWDSDASRLPSQAYQVNLQSRVTQEDFQDKAPQRFFTSVLPSLETHSNTFRTFINLQNDFIAETQVDDPLHEDKQEDIDDFLAAVLNTNLTRTTHYFLNQMGAVGSEEADMRKLLHDVWFVPYSRSKKFTGKDSSGFEHVFVGETRGEKVIGFHNWIRFYLEERKLDDVINYHGYISVTEPEVIAVQFSWQGKRKNLGTFFLGSSPEFDLCVYTICFVLQPNQRCSFSIHHNPVTIQTFDMTSVPGLQLGTAFPVTE
ncbi:hypothetical protein CAPTEDRAFT_223490 [Capitella teleta]|uniref:Uridylate-specific endoribonuclease n=1 Tax=Capitella teleta TaxID=283909 RepID=R7VB55_CAPTE|nr:hypothetical protein CAPTEDRAFT_223490 [Capitella teleta]|eukprot:ELU16063.1 hypothetical protein CAPTEDRAFT_223490 [Capitella teleta]